MTLRWDALRGAICGLFEKTTSLRFLYRLKRPWKQRPLSLSLDTRVVETQSTLFVEESTRWQFFRSGVFFSKKKKREEPKGLLSAALKEGHRGECCGFFQNGPKRSLCERNLSKHTLKLGENRKDCGRHPTAQDPLDTRSLQRLGRLLHCSLVARAEDAVVLLGCLGLPKVAASLPVCILEKKHSRFQKSRASSQRGLSSKKTQSLLSLSLHVCHTKRISLVMSFFSRWEETPSKEMLLTPLPRIFEKK